MSSRLAVVLLVALPMSAAAQAVPTYPGDSITSRARPPHPVYVSPGPIAPTLPGDTLLGGALSVKAAVPLHPIAPTMPGDVITQRPQWVLDTLHADSIRQGLIAPDSAAADSLDADARDEPGFRVLPDAGERADSLRAAPAPGRLRDTPEKPRRKRRDDGIRQS
jgi:hypothetical protein